MAVVKPLVGNTLLLGLIAYVVVFALTVLLAVLCVLYEDRLRKETNRAANNL